MSSGLDGEFIVTVEAGTEVEILEVGLPTRIDDISSNWVRVTVPSNSSGIRKDGSPVFVPNGTTGWCFGGYLK